MRHAKSYSIVDHELLHAGHLGRLSHEALALYLFFVVVGNFRGRSFYASETICDLLRLPFEVSVRAKGELVSSRLIVQDERGVRVTTLSYGARR
jgi:hypothetical protein